VKLLEQIGAFAGLASFLGLGLFALLSFTQARDIRRLREWAGSAPERDAERKESTSAVAAQRAEELRKLEEARTTEREATDLREERRQRREASLPELTRGERLRDFLSAGGRLAEPRYLIGIFVAVIVIGGGVAYAVIQGGGESGASGKSDGKVQAAEVEVTVLNGTAVPGLAASYGHKVERKGFKLGVVTNSSSSFVDSVVMYKPSHAAEGHRVAKMLGIAKVQQITSEISSASHGAPVAVIVGEDNASSTP
jgi:hypothetical protein